MADLTLYICPKCGAELSVSTKDKFVQCSYCGLVGQRELDNSEQSSLNAQMLVQKLTEYRKYMPQYEQLQSEWTKAQKDLNSFKRKPQKTGTGVTAKAGAVGTGILGAVIYAAVVIGITLLVHWKYPHWWVYLIGGLMALGAFSIGAETISDGLNNIEQSDSYEKALARYNDVCARREKLLSEFDVGFIPEQYRNTKAIDYVLNLLSSGLSTDLGDAFRRYDEYEHYAKMEAMQKKQLDLQQKQLDQLNKMNQPTNNIRR